MKNSEKTLVMVHGVYRRRSAELGEPARYFDMNGVLRFVECRICHKGRTAEQLKTESENICTDCNRKQRALWGVDNGAASDQRQFTKRRARSSEQVRQDQKRLRHGGVKLCRSCGETKTIQEFYADVLESDGLKRKCKVCHIDKTWKRNARAYWLSVGMPLVCFYGKGCAFESYDHVKPTIKGGSNDVHNLVPCCLSHNGSKQDSRVEEWVEDWDTIKREFNRYGIDYAEQLHQD